MITIRSLEWTKRHLRMTSRERSASWRASTIPVSYTHLDVYKRQTKNGETITYGSTPIQSFTLPDENDKFTATIEDLPAASDAGVPYYYKVEEAAPTADTPAAYYTLQTDPIEFDFWDEDNNKPSANLTFTANFVNELTTSDLIILKQSQELGGTAKAKAGVTFAIYDQVPAAGVKPVSYTHL